ncbi:MAG: hypothetical protein WD768_17835 [Phycisphaeraceae bacterium]
MKAHHPPSGLHLLIVLLAASLDGCSKGESNAPPSTGPAQVSDPQTPAPPPFAVVKVDADWGNVERVPKGSKRTEEWVPVWFDVPDDLTDKRFTKPRPYQGALKVTIEKDGIVWLAVSNEKWGDPDHSGGAWRKELRTREQLLGEGWTVKGLLNEGEYLLLTRVFKAGDSFLVRTRKYTGPILFLPREKEPVGK